jgi:hypothetical protein
MNNELYHYNHNHDPKTGKFISSNFSGIRIALKRAKDKRTEKTKNKLLSEGNINKILKKKKLYTTEELDKARDRAKVITDLENARKEEKQLSEKEKKKEEKKEEKKRKDFDKGDVSKILKNSESYTTAELEDARKRIQAINELEKQKFEKEKRNLGRAVEAFRMIRDLSQVGYDVYKNVSGIKDMAEKEIKSKKEEKKVKLGKKIAKDALSELKNVKITNDNYNEIYTKLDRQVELAKLVNNAEALSEGRTISNGGNSKKPKTRNEVPAVKENTNNGSDSGGTESDGGNSGNNKRKFRFKK